MSDREPFYSVALDPEELPPITLTWAEVVEAGKVGKLCSIDESFEGPTWAWRLKVQQELSKVQQGLLEQYYSAGDEFYSSVRCEYPSSWNPPSCQINSYKLILIDCDDSTRESRLRVDRRQPELANPQKSRVL